VSPRAGLDVVANRNNVTPAGDRTPAVQPVFTHPIVQVSDRTLSIELSRLTTRSSGKMLCGSEWIFSLGYRKDLT